MTLWAGVEQLVPSWNMFLPFSIFWPGEKGAILVFICTSCRLLHAYGLVSTFLCSLLWILFLD